MSTKQCRLCHSEETSVCLELKRMPRNIQRLLKKDELDADCPVSLSLRQCDRCGFVQLPPVLDSDYYDDYLMTTSHSLQMREYQDDQAKDFVERFGLKGKHVKEMGCGDGNYLSHLAAAGAIASGIEPSEKFRKLAIERGFDVESGYVTSGRHLLGSPFDGFVTRQVLEHVPDIHDFLSCIRGNLKEGAYGLIEVPSLEKALLDRRFYDFFPDHVNYFSQRTLRLSLELNGFEVLETKSGMFGEYNIAIVRLPVSDDLSAVQSTLNSLSREIELFIAQTKSKGKKVAIWGAGGKGLSVMSAADVSLVDMLVDGDVHKQGLYSPLSHLLVQAPKILKNDSNLGAVLITAMAYHREILKQLREEYGFTGTIALLGHTLEIMQ